MSVATIAAVATVGSAAYGVYASNKASKDAKRSTQSQLANQTGISNSQFGAMNEIAEEQFGMSMALQEEYISFMKESLEKYGVVADAYAEKAPGIAEQAYQNVSDVIQGINTPDVSAFIEQAKSLSVEDFNFRDSYQKYNLNFITGDTQGDIREAQAMSASLAALDPSAFQGKMGEILRSDMYGLKALTVGEPTGTFANLSAQNLSAMQQQGLSNWLQISDFFSREGTVDPISPLQTAFDLENANTNKEFNIAQLSIRNEENRGSNLLNIANQIVDNEKFKVGASGDIGNSGLKYGTDAINTLGSQLLASQSMLSNNLIGVSNGQIAQGSVDQANKTNQTAQIVSAVSGAATTYQNYKNSQVQADYYKTLNQAQVAKSAGA